MKKLPIAAGAATLALGLSAPVVLMTTGAAAGLPGSLARQTQDNERTVRCGVARIELRVDRERGGFDVDGDVDDAKPGSRWKVVIRHDGEKVLSRTRTADAEGDVDVDTWRHNSAGNDTFKLRVKNLDTDKVCKVTITTR